jgi:phosphatidylglycerophosphatase A
VPVRWPYVAIGLVLFRFFDIAKPLYIRRMEHIGGGWGVMMDDVLAGLYANLLLEIVVWIKPW